MRATLSVNADALLGLLSRASQRAATGLEDNDLRNGFGQAQESYLAAMRERFTAEGDGGWRPLAPVTQAERAHLGFSPAHPILERLGYLYGGLVPGEPGNVFEATGNSFIAGYGGGFVHPGYATPDGKIVGGDVPLSQIAWFHQHGGGRVAARPILVPPSGATLETMEVSVAAGVRSLWDHAATGGTL